MDKREILMLMRAYAQELDNALHTSWPTEMDEDEIIRFAERICDLAAEHKHMEDDASGR